MKKLKLLLLLSISIFVLSACQNSNTASDNDSSNNDIEETIIIDEDSKPENGIIDEDSEVINDNVDDTDTSSLENETDTSQEDTTDNESENSSNNGSQDITEDTSEDNAEETTEETTEDNAEPWVSPNHDAIQELVSQKYELLEIDDSFEKTHDVYEINKQIAELNCYDFSDTKITFLGDSITFGQGGDWNQYNNLISYVDYVRDILGCETKNISTPGAPIGRYNGYDGIMYKADLIPNDTDIIVIFGGINDFMFGDEYYGDDTNAEGTFSGDAKIMFETIREKFPDTPIYVITIYHNKVEENAKNSIPLSSYMQLLRVYANEYNCKVIDLYKYNLMNNTVLQNLANYFDDILHPNNNGYMWLGRYVAAEIVEDFN